MYLLKLLRYQSLPDAQLSVIAYAVIISHVLCALPACGAFLSVELVSKINAFFGVCIGSAVFNVVLL